MYGYGVREEDYLTLSGIQHYAFCPRQWALIFIEQQWADNVRTIDGNLLHRRAHDENLIERRGDMLIARGLRVVSHELNATGVCDVVEFHSDPGGISLPGQTGLWRVYPVEYKRGSPKENDADALQLCGQAMCLEEMLCCDIREGALFYGQTRRRVPVSLSDTLRERVRAALEEMHALYRRGHTPLVKPSKGCGACSLKALCLPALTRAGSAARYLAEAIGGESEP